MSQENNSVNYSSEETQTEHKDEEHYRFGRGRRGNQEENGEDSGQNTDRKNDNPRGPNKDSNRPDSGSEKNNQNDHENSETPPASEDENQNELPEGGDKPDKRGDSEDGRDGRGRDNNNSDGQVDEGEEEFENVEREEDEEECDKQNPELDHQNNSGHPNGHHDFSDDGDHSDHDGRNHHLPPPDSSPNEVSSGRPGFLERASGYTITISSETMFEVLVGSLLILVSAVFLFIYLAKRQRRKAMRGQSPVHALQLVTPNQNIATSNFYQYYQKEGVIPTGTVVGYIPEGKFLHQPGAKNVENLKNYGRFPTQDEILDLS